MRSRTCGGRVATLGGEGVHTGRKGRYTARISLLMKRSDLGRVRFEAVLRSVHRFVGLVLRAVAGARTSLRGRFIFSPPLGSREQGKGMTQKPMHLDY